MRFCRMTFVIVRLKDFTGWMIKYALQAPGRTHRYDGFALGMYRAVLQARDSWIASRPDLPAHFLQKLLFADTDITRLANVAMRKSQFLQDTISARSEIYLDAGSASSRQDISVHELAHALHSWRRQLHLHWSLYSWDQRCGPFAGGNTSGAGAVGGRPVLSTPDALQKLLLSNARVSGSYVSAADARRWCKHFFKSNNVLEGSKMLKAAVKELHVAGILEMHEGQNAAAEPGGAPAVEEDADDVDDAVEERPRLRGGHITYQFRKRLWSEISTNDEAVARLGRLRVSHDVFP